MTEHWSSVVSMEVGDEPSSVRSETAAMIATQHERNSMTTMTLRVAESNLGAERWKRLLLYQ